MDQIRKSKLFTLKENHPNLKLQKKSSPWKKRITQGKIKIVNHLKMKY